MLKSEPRARACVGVCESVRVRMHEFFKNSIASEFEQLNQIE
jgi:hypothetical protein